MKGEAFVLDTNVLISAALAANSPPAQVTLWVIAYGRLLFSEETFTEFRTRLWRPKFDKYLTIERRNQLLHDFSAIADWADISQISTPAPSRDPNDDMFVQTAIAGTARWLVSGDRDLLEIPPFEGVTILSPADLLGKILPK
ncbi:putative toxin-antitoxin system toxin component, PIN family [Sandaracinobacter sp. RS1-74]|uniref:putative toxin-antitoxin system toxin component, PIN family n=1 Tax=Sandaracinobacteroides sayramensis TaxID=2913411 RepID=UPI001EDC0118|nr:putative toxin-antitoxin system toxin component, PIN family [Sandaracinobacteroides sayramensis]MCG2842380.1 putative toxin-antitoxin system toxin component, PIN family [Sandaracinobacteroides sayramensis]